MSYKQNLKINVFLHIFALTAKYSRNNQVKLKYIGEEFNGIWQIFEDGLAEKSDRDLGTLTVEHNVLSRRFAVHWYGSLNASNAR